VRQLGDGLDFAEEAVNRLAVGEPVGMDDLEGDDAPHQAVAGLEDLTHAAFAETLQQDVLTQD
jgi:hypothetical protein